MTADTEGLGYFNLSGLFDEQSLPVPGSALLLVGVPQELVVACSWQAAFILRQQRDLELVYTGTTFIAPPIEVWPHGADSTFELLLRGLPASDGIMYPAEKAALREMFTFVRCSDLQCHSLVTAFHGVVAQSFVYVPYVTLYSNTEALTARVSALPTLDEDTWMKNTMATAQQLITLAKQKSCFLFLTSPVAPPVSQANRDLVSDTQSLTLASFRTQSVELSPLQLQKILALAKIGRSEEALDLLNTMDVPDFQKLLARIQIAHQSGDSKTAAGLIRQLMQQTTLTADYASHLAVICYQGDDFQATKRLIEGSLDEISREVALVAYLEAATGMRNADLVERAWRRLHALFPANPGLRYDCGVRMLQICYQSAYEAQTTPIARTGFTEFHTLVLSRLVPESEGDYQELLDEVCSRWPEHHDIAAICAAAHAKVYGNLQAAWSLAGLLVPNTDLAPDGARLIMECLSESFLTEDAEPDLISEYGLILKLVTEYLGRNPEDKWIRGSLLNLLSVESSGGMGLPFIAAIATDFAHEIPKPAEEEPDFEMATSEEHAMLMQRWSEWAREQGVFDPRLPLPVDVAGTNARGLARLMRHYIEHSVLEFDRADDLEELSVQARILTALLHHVPSTYDDLYAFRALTAKFCMINNHQRARDLAELILEIAGDKPGRKRLAWSIYADIYQRSHHVIDALMALACAGATRAQLPAHDLFQDTYTLLRILRDMGLHAKAELLLERYRKFSSELGMTDILQNRLNVVSLCIQINKQPNRELSAVRPFFDRCKAAFFDAVRLGDELSPASHLFL